MKAAPKRSGFAITGGTLCLDFANTVAWRRDPARRQDHLSTYAALISWLTQSPAMSSGKAQRPARQLLRSLGKSDTFFRQAITLREAIYRIFSATARTARPELGDLDRLNIVVSEMLSRMRIVPEKRGFTWMWNVKKEDALVSFLWPIAKSAADLLTSDQLRSVRECRAKDCGWLFLDKSANKSRRWCDMKDCGNRAKARRHYERSRQKSNTSIWRSGGRNV